MSTPLSLSLSRPVAHPPTVDDPSRTAAAEFSGAVYFDRALVARYSGKGPRYTSYPTADRFVEDFGEDDYRGYLAALGNAGRPPAPQSPLSLYVHIPFCNTICYYCACNKQITKDHSKAEVYLDHLLLEIERQHAGMVGISGRSGASLALPPVSQLHFGGGTPTSLNAAQFSRLMDRLHRHFDFLPEGEFSIELDPRRIDPAGVAHLAQLGLNRISLGVQDFNSQVQQAVNRIQSFAQTQAIVEIARSTGFRSISLDLIYGLPHQSRATMQQTLEQVLAIRPDRLSLYSYAHLPERFPPQRRIAIAALPTAEEKLDILQLAIERLGEAGYLFIGMDHFALPGDELALAQREGRLHRNFQGYSTQAERDLLAFGVSAIGKLGQSYSQNEKDLEPYYQRLAAGQLPIARGRHLNIDDTLRRAVIQQLMCQFAIDYAAFAARHAAKLPGFVFSEYFAAELAALAPLVGDGLLSLEKTTLRVLPRGRLLVRAVAMQFDRYLATRPAQASYSRII